MSTNSEELPPSVDVDPKLLNTFGVTALVSGLVTGLLGFSLFQESSFIRYFALLVWFASTLLLLKAWVCLSIGREQSFWSFHRVCAWLLTLTHPGRKPG